MDRTFIIFPLYLVSLCSQVFSVIGDCARPSFDSDEIAITPDQELYGIYDVISVTCKGNATLVGISEKIYCKDDGNWNRGFSLADCYDDCSLASLDDNIRAIFMNSAIEGNLLQHATTIEFECNGVVSGSTSSTCSDGSWSNQLPVCILDTFQTTSSQVPPPFSTNTTTSIGLKSSSSQPTLEPDGDKTTVPDDDLSTQIASTTMNAATTTTIQFATNILVETDNTTPDMTINVTAFKETTNPETMPTTNLIDVTSVQTTSPRLADMSTTISAGVMTTERIETISTSSFDLKTSKTTQFTDTAPSTGIINGTVMQTEVFTTELGVTTPENDQKATDIDLTSQHTITTPSVRLTDAKESGTFTAILMRTTVQTDVLTDGNFSTPAASTIAEIEDEITTKLTTVQSTSVEYMKTKQQQTTQPTDIKITSVQNMTSPIDFHSTLELGGKTTTGRSTTNLKDFSTVKPQTVTQTELLTETYSTVTLNQTEKSATTSQNDLGRTTDGEETTSQLTELPTTGVQGAKTEDPMKTSYQPTNLPTATDHTSMYDLTSLEDYSSTMQPAEKSTMEADKTDGVMFTTRLPLTLIETDLATEKSFVTKITTGIDKRMTSVHETTSHITGKTNDAMTTKLDPTTQQPLQSTSINAMTTIQDSFTIPVTTRPNTVGKDVTSPKVTDITTVVDDTPFTIAVTSTLGGHVTTYLTTEDNKMTTPSLGNADVSDLKTSRTNQSSSTEITTNVDLEPKTSVSITVTEEKDTVPITKQEVPSTSFRNQPTLKTEFISGEASSTTSVLKETTEIYERVTTTSEKRTSEMMATSPGKMTTHFEKITTSKRMTTGSDNMTSHSSNITTKVSGSTTHSQFSTDEQGDASTSGEETGTTKKIISTSASGMATSGHGTTSKTTTSPPTCGDILCMLPSAFKCDNSGQLPVCVCREGYFRKTIEQTCTEAESFQNSVRVISRTNGQTVYYNRLLEDSTSEIFISLASDICTAIDAIFENYNSTLQFYLGCKVFRFRQGSIIADFVTYFRTSSDITKEDNEQIIQLSLEANNVLPSSNLIIDPDSITSMPTNECDLGLDDCDYWNADCIDEGASGFSCQCKDGYRDDSPESLPGRTCTEVSVNAALLVSILLILCLVILATVLMFLLLTIRRTKVSKRHQKEYRAPIHVDSEIALYAMGEVIPIE